MSELLELAERCERARADETHELLLLAALASGGDRLAIGRIRACAMTEAWESAAVALVERVLPGWWYTFGKCGLTCHASVGPDRAFIAEPELSRFDAGFDVDIPNPSTPALALVAATLRARAAKGETK